MRGSPRPRADYPETPCRLQQGLQVEIGTPFGTGRILTLRLVLSAASPGRFSGPSE